MTQDTYTFIPRPGKSPLVITREEIPMTDDKWARLSDKQRFMQAAMVALNKTLAECNIALEHVKE